MVVRDSLTLETLLEAEAVDVEGLPSLIRLGDLLSGEEEDTQDRILGPTDDS